MYNDSKFVVPMRYFRSKQTRPSEVSTHIFELYLNSVAKFMSKCPAQCLTQVQTQMLWWRALVILCSSVHFRPLKSTYFSEPIIVLEPNCAVAVQVSLGTELCTFLCLGEIFFQSEFCREVDCGCINKKQFLLFWNQYQNPDYLQHSGISKAHFQDLKS